LTSNLCAKYNPKLIIERLMISVTDAAKIAFPISAGGIVYRFQGDKLQILLCGRKHPSEWLWALPKGTPEIGESLRDTAVREVMEETGLHVNISERIGSISYWFIRSNDEVKCYKTVHFFLMNRTGGSEENHDSEFDLVEWVDHLDSSTKLTHDTERSILNKAINMIRSKQI